MATIVKRRKKYCVVYYYVTADGTQKQKWETFDKQADAKKRKAEIEYRMEYDDFQPPTAATVKDLLKEYVETYGIAKWQPSTYDAKMGLIANYINPLIGDVPLKKITPHFMDNYYKQLRSVKAVLKQNHKDRGEFVSARNVIEIHKIFSTAFDLGVKWGYFTKNPVEHATLPQHEPEVRDIWSVETLFHALELCEDELLYLCINLAFADSLRIGEITGLTWDNVDISPESIEANEASFVVEKQLQRVTRASMEALNGQYIYQVIPSILPGGRTMLVLKKPKTQKSVRRVWLPRTVAELLVETKRKQEELKEILGDEYHDYNLVVALSNGRPVEGRLIDKAFKKFIEDNDLPPIKFHSLRATSTTYKLILTKGDIKAVQGDTGHAQAKMVTDTYARILDESRKRHAQRFEEAYYQNKELRPALSEEGAPNGDMNELMALAQQSPEMMSLLLKAARAMVEKSM